MTSVYLPEHAVLSPAQRRCRLLLTLCLPDCLVTLESVCQLNGVDLPLVRQDIAELTTEIQRNHHLAIEQDGQGRLSLNGTALNQRLCLMHGLRRAMRVSPQFVSGWFADAVKRRLQAQFIDKALYSEHNLTRLIRHCSQRLAREFSLRDSHFLHIWLQFSLAWPCQPQFSSLQQQWLQHKAEYALAQEIIRCWQKRGWPADDNQAALLALLFSQLHAPLIEEIACESERSLLQAVELLIQCFQQIAGIEFHHKAGLSVRLYTHLAQALERTLFAIAIDDNLAENVALQYPRLLRTTREAIVAVEQQYAVTFSQEEVELMAIIFGAWLVQEHAPHEKQVLLLTGKNPKLERQIEQQLRELTLLPLNIKYLDVNDFQRDSAPPGITLVISPYATSLPLYSPPLIHAELPLGEHQQQSIRTLLES
ncbi:stationary phase inducible protein CsiE [Erwinia pyrifoliae]|uniref:stationary phase inducible protein CsiE n=1 Tax=Erwinia pyrifoliae TaxID=79967 RepID=UPI00019609DB|nr:stationary phase inducible protein CsiE [Erwinia pyrifoliae]AUX73423.1 stationary phase inducible protein CsiE [Erwinia pyrifoliae]MCA8876279.1 stationary phase inducible protein CsiE [Erwinia pyrifoliae]UXK11386.1 stationary phase inducible protein CsiE [Erwinia pyrifoliae]CAX54802.1 Stationary phase-inducible protein [Erwinia pyrifoliae Ep1/96]CAY73465.1 Stationary phase-inducible protein csiE [Erwinia pyrifoliae DSM 12163]